MLKDSYLNVVEGMLLTAQMSTLIDVMTCVVNDLEDDYEWLRDHPFASNVEHEENLRQYIHTGNKVLNKLYMADNQATLEVEVDEIDNI